jgi:hypothetical protein
MKERFRRWHRICVVLVYVRARQQPSKYNRRETGNAPDEDVNDTGGHTGLLDKLGHVEGGEWSELGWLHDNCATSSESRSNFPREHVDGL